LRKVIGYVRVSTEQQAAEGLSLEAQKVKVVAWCELNGFSLAGLYVDAGLSGKRADNRPELQKALDAVIECGGILLVYSLSRLARSTRDTLLISDRLEKADADLVSLSEKIDTTSAAGKMVFRMLAVLAEFERDLVSERTVSALEHKRKQGGRMGQIPFGYTVAADGDTLVPAPEEQAVIQHVRAMRQQGATLKAIAEKLQADRVLNKAGRPRWNTTQVHRMLSKMECAG
jgi:site-specific DNA recombinase